MKTQILDHQQVQKILKRMAYQIYEKNFDQKELVFAAIKGQGMEVAKLVQSALQEISKIKISLIELEINKKAPVFNGATLTPANSKLQNKTLVLFDDVLNTGRTLVYGMQAFLQENVAAVQIAVLVDRNHKSYPVAADYIGLSLQTTLQEHVSVIMKSGKISVSLL